MSRHITFSNVVALVALFIALGSGAYAASKLTGSEKKQVKSIANKQIKAKQGKLKVKSAKSLKGVQIQSFSKALTKNETAKLADLGQIELGARCLNNGGEFPPTVQVTLSNGSATEVRSGALWVRADGSTQELARTTGSGGSDSVASDASVAGPIGTVVIDLEDGRIATVDFTGGGSFVACSLDARVVVTG